MQLTLFYLYLPPISIKDLSLTTYLKTEGRTTFHTYKLHEDPLRTYV